MSENTNAVAVETLADAVAVEASMAAPPVETNDAPPAVETSDKPKGKKSKGKKGKGKAKADKPVAPFVERDVFGNRVNTSSHAINAVIIASRKPMTITEIHASAGDEGRANVGATRQHVMWLLAKGLVKLKDGGYVKAERRKGKPKADDKPADDDTAAS